MEVWGCQLDIVWEEKEVNFARVRALLERAPIPAGSLLVLPEMFATGFSMRVDSIAEGPIGETADFLAQTARQYRISIVGGVVTKNPDGRGRNEAVVFDPQGAEIARYCKMHPFSYGGETRHYTSGDRPVCFPCHGFAVAPFICYDLRFPEVFRSATVAGAQLLIVIANWPEARAAHWRTLLQARAIENQAYVVGVNRCGSDPKLRYSGDSLILDPRGAILADAGSTEGPIHATLDLSTLLTYRQEFPALQDIHRDYIHE
jgi:omega-amidase